MCSVKEHHSLAGLLISVVLCCLPVQFFIQGVTDVQDWRTATRTGQRCVLLWLPVALLTSACDWQPDLKARLGSQEPGLSCSTVSHLSCNSMNPAWEVNYWVFKHD